MAEEDLSSNSPDTARDSISAQPHLLDPLNPAEILRVREAVVEHAKQLYGLEEALRFSYVTLKEPFRSVSPDVLDTAPAREAEVVVHLPPVVPHMLIVRLSVDGDAHVCFDEPLPPSTQPVLTPADCLLAERIVKEDHSVLALVADAYGVSDPDCIVCDPWSVHLTDAETVPSLLKAAGIESSEKPHPRLVQTFLYSRPAGKGFSHNHYSHPLHLLPIVDLARRRVLIVQGSGRTDKPSMPNAHVNYFPDTLHTNSYLARTAHISGLKPLDVVQCDGVSFSVEGRLVKWHKWAVRVGFNHREGLVLHDVQYDGREILRRASLTEMAVPYADPRAPFTRKCAFDVGDYGLGYCAGSLTAGCDCLGAIHYMNACLADADGKPYDVPNAICIHEEDAGILHKHVEYRTGEFVVRRNRKLVFSFIATVVNYEYLFYWSLALDGSISLDIKLSGELSTNSLSEGEITPSHGTIVAPGVNAQVHQHMFCARLEPTIDGSQNRVHELDVVPAGPGGCGNAFGISETLLESEAKAMRDSKPGRSWRISNKTVTNKISGKAVAFRLVPASTGVPLLTHSTSAVSRRARFATRALWVTKLEEEERYPAGEFPTQVAPRGGDTSEIGFDGVEKWAKERDASIVDKEIVLWHSFGVTHVPRVEDFPVMPCESVGFSLKPDGFFEGNPGVDLPDLPSKQSLCSN